MRPPKHDAFDAFSDTTPFTVEIEGLGRLAFREISGLGAPGGRPPDEITCQFGTTRDGDALRAWVADVETLRIARRAVTVTLHDVAGTPVATWHLPHAFPLRAGPFTTGPTGTTVEMLDLAHDGIKTDQG
ncbi:phage tail protein [Jannaschia sp. M317]|uniref:phage tail protein n=1 Tax=Jannaschia sp. M317 TaxID=2867011 RepID=UPI0021A699EC|nr:phage tail protein [Jannaschia sp. M317]UWQ16182.1 phage tail protein [Jannaschia sp. M317]